jgi:diguanylate cyclase (GGDEF)-like protein
LGANLQTARRALTSSHLITTCATLAALVIFVSMGNQVFSAAFGSRPSDETLRVAFILNIAIILFGWRRSKDLKQALEAQERAEQLAFEGAFVDHVTGLANRRQLMERLTEAAGESRPSTLLLLDLDFFKNVNDLHGHVAGDQVLRNVADTIKANVPETSCCARLGGDEFAVILHDSDPRAVDEIVANITTGIARPFSLDRVVVHVSASVGISEVGADKSPEDCLRRSDIAMYSAKRAGRNCSVWFDDQMERELFARTELEDDIRQGIAAGEFIPFFQPQISLETGGLTGFEVLARWDSPERGLLEPDSFIQVAEASGLIGALSMSVMRRALVESRDWPADLKVAVNISPVQFRDPKLAQQILKIVTEVNFPAQRLEIEITESALMEDRDVALSTIESLKNVGITISLDDFGTGYASLSQLRSLPFDRIKIDKSFVATLLGDPQSSAIVNSITSLGKALHLPITAEGVETNEVKDQLSEIGCSEAQGWLFGKALPAMKVRELLKLSDRSENTADQELPDTTERRDRHRRAASGQRAPR